MEEPLQKSLERYDVLDRIAVGGMAEVFLAKAYGAHGFEKTLAIKRILPELARDPEFEARFIAEAKVSVRLSHANVVQVLDFGRMGESLFIAMEYVDGLDLAALQRKYKDEDRQIPLPAAFHMAIELIRALDYAHQHNVVHRDVSPSNILLSRAGEVKIADFGIAVAAQPHKGGGPGPRKVMGKWRYMSPEQTRGDTLDTRSDLFSAASVLFELFTGTKLFPGDDAEAIIRNIHDMPIPKASSVRNQLPSRLDDILGQALARKPIDRPGRPAILLRSLIELSYESSIMATALDVAEAVASVLPAKRPSGGGQQLDDVIRKQLGQADKSIARQTAVTGGKPPSTQTAGAGEVSTGLFRKIQIDGISRLEEVQPQVIDPTAVAAPRARRATGEQVAQAETESGLHKLLDAHFDPDRRTEVGGPPTGQVAKLDSGAPAPERTPRDSIITKTGVGGAPASRSVIVIAGVVAAGGIALGAWALTSGGSRGGTPEPVGSGSGGSAIAETMGAIAIDPDPEGATGTISDADGHVVKTFGPTAHGNAVRLRVTAGQPFKVHIELPGHKSFDDVRTVVAGETMLIAPRLDKARATLHVVTVPPGAQVTLAGRLLGETPLVRDDLDAVTAADLSVARTGFDPVRLKIDLAAGKTTEVDQPLKAALHYGTISITFVGRGWGDVYFKGAKVGQAPLPELRLPVGTQRLRLKNTGKTPAVEWDVTCQVAEDRVIPCVTKLP